MIYYIRRCADEMYENQFVEWAINLVRTKLCEWNEQKEEIMN